MINGVHAEVAELVDALASGASGRKLVEVQVLSSVPDLFMTLASFHEPASVPENSMDRFSPSNAAPRVRHAVYHAPPLASQF
jgi:hypothetical protein